MFKIKNTKNGQSFKQFFVKKNNLIRQKLSNFAIQISHKLSGNNGNLIVHQNDQNHQNIPNIIETEDEVKNQIIKNETVLQKDENWDNNNFNKKASGFVNKDLEEKELEKNTTLHIISQENKELITQTLEELKITTEEKTSEIRESLTKTANEKMIVVNQKLHEFMIKMTQNLKKLSRSVVELKKKFEKSQIHTFDYSNFVTEKNFILVNKTILSWIFPISVWVRTVGILVTLVITFLSWTEGKNQINPVGLLAIFVFSFSLVFVLSRKFLEGWKNRFEDKDFKVRFLTTFGILFLLSLQFWPVVGSILFTFAFQSSFLVFTTTILASSLTIFGHYFLLNIIPKKEILGNLLIIGGFLTWYAIFRFSFGAVFPDFVNIIYIFVIANTFSQINAIDLLKLNLQTIGLSLLVYVTTTKFPSGVELMVLGFICALGVMIRVALDFWQILIKTFRKNEELLHNTLPPSIAKRLQNETLIADSFESASVLFCDIVGYTTYSSGKNPEEVVKTLNFIFSQFDKLCEELGLEKIKTIGDAYMVAGGLMGNWENHAHKIAQMGLGIRQIIRNLNSEFGLNMRIGIHSGKVVAGVIGLKKFTYDIWGDTVNVASRMESHSLPGQIQISKATWELIKNDFEFSKPNTIPIKGKGEMITYFLIDQKNQLDIQVNKNKIQNSNEIQTEITNNSDNNLNNSKEQKKIDNLPSMNISFETFLESNETNFEQKCDFDVNWNEVLEENYENINQNMNQISKIKINKPNYPINLTKINTKKSQIIKIIPNRKLLKY